MTAGAAVDTTSVTPTSITSPVMLARAFDHARHVAKQHARNFYYGMKLMPEPKRSAMYAIYTFMRACDDLADETAQRAADQAVDSVEVFRQTMQHIIDGGDPPRNSEQNDQLMWLGFTHVMRAYPIDTQLLHDMLDGQIEDLRETRYETFDDLYRYCYRVAGTVGLVCISVWGYKGGAATRQLAESRGIAFQLTNILRDLVEDAQRGRYYLPAEELERFNVDPQQFTGGDADDHFLALMRFQIIRARDYCQQSADLEQYLTADCRPAAAAMRRTYQALLEKIAHDPARVLRQRVRLGRLRKTAIALRAAWRCSMFE